MTTALTAIITTALAASAVIVWAGIRLGRISDDVAQSMAEQSSEAYISWKQATKEGEPMSQELETPGEIIKQYISLWGTNQKKIAKEIGISPQHLSDIIQHKRTPSPSVAYDIFDALRMSASSQKKCIEFWLKDLLLDWRIGVIVMKPSIAFVPRPRKQATKEGESK